MHQSSLNVTRGNLETPSGVTVVPVLPYPAGHRAAGGPT